MPIDLDFLYLLKGIAGNEGVPGAPLLHFYLTVNSETGAVTGHAKQTQAIPPPNNVIPIDNIKGRLRNLGLGSYIKVVYLEGRAIVSLPPPAIGELVLPFEAIFVFNNDWKGKGSWSIGNKHVDDVPVEATI